MKNKIKDFFQDDFPVTKHPYFLSLVYALGLGILLYSGLKVSDLVVKSAFYGIVSLAIIILALWFSKKLGFNFLNFKPLNFSDFLYAFTAFLVIKFLDFLFIFIQSESGANDQAITDTFAGTSIWLLIISLAIVPAFVEEFIFRGLILRVVFRNHLLIGLIVSSILFATSHGAGHLIEYIPYFYSAIIFGLVYLHTKKIEVSILAHFLNNILFVIFLILYS